MAEKKSRQKPIKLDLYSRLHPSLSGHVDGRTKAAKLLKTIRDGLLDQLGHAPSFSENILIDRTAMLTLRCSQIDAIILSGQPLTQHDNNFAVSWNNALRRCLVELGLGTGQQAAQPEDPYALLRQVLATQHERLAAE